MKREHRTSNIEHRTSNGKAVAVLALAALALGAGCASPYDGVRRGPFLHRSVNRAYQMAERQGDVPVMLGKSLAWIERERFVALGVPEFKADLQAADFVAREVMLREAARNDGVPCSKIVRKYNAAGLRWAIAGETFTWSSLAGLITAGIEKLTEKDDGKKADAPAPPADDVEVDVRMQGDRQRVDVNYQYLPGGGKPKVKIDATGNDGVIDVDVAPFEG